MGLQRHQWFNPKRYHGRLILQSPYYECIICMHLHVLASGEERSATLCCHEAFARQRIHPEQIADSEAASSLYHHDPWRVFLIFSPLGDAWALDRKAASFCQNLTTSLPSSWWLVRRGHVGNKDDIANLEDRLRNDSHRDEMEYME